MHDLWSACHGAIWHNLRYYYNPVTALLEPVAFDAEPFRWCDQSQTIINEFVSTQIFDDPQIRSAYARELERLTQPGYIESIQAELEGEMLQLHPALGVEFPQVDLGVDWQALKERSLALSLELQPAQPVRGSYQLAQPVSGETGKPVLHLDLVNLMLLPVDVSGTQATLSGGRMERIGDKGVSVGEKSVMRVENVEMDTVSIGIASKDLSMVTVTGTSIRNARFAALAAYIKKPVFGPAKIEAADMTIVDTKTEAIAQKGSTILLRGEAVEAVDLDVDRLYQEGILGN